MSHDDAKLIAEAILSVGQFMFWGLILNGLARGLAK